MTITALSDDIVRLLGSPTVITTPVDLVKELLDNALDAKATSVGISISQNTIDRIEVRDNGDGIHSDDYNFLGCTGHTSKISSFEELQTLGGAMLGFRGLALASANTLGTVTITTRTAEDSTAQALKLSPDVGGVESQQPASAPVGTTVNVTGLFNRLPVRAEFVVKKAQAYLAKIKQLLHSYALARPQVRLSLKVLGESSKQSWLYSPAPGATVKEAVVQVFGVEVMAQCLIRTLCSNAVAENSCDSRSEEKLTIEAVLPKPGADQSKISSKVTKGCFFAVDSRPLSAQRETMKKLTATFKTYYSKSCGLFDGQTISKHPCICVNIRCSPGSYDPNIEPSKDSVLFAQESRLTELFERLLSDLYDSQGSPSSFVTIGKRQLLGRRQTHTPPVSSSGPNDVASDPSALVEGRPKQPHQMEQTPVLSSSRAIHGRPDGPFLSSNARLSPRLLGEYRPEGSHLAEPFIVPSPSRYGRTHDPTADHVQVQTDQPNMLSNAPYQCTIELVPRPPRRPAPNQTGNRGWSVNMSADPDMSSDEEAEVLASRFRMQQATHSQQEEQDVDPREGLNPWSIARMTAPARPLGDSNAFMASKSREIVQLQETQVLPDEVFDDLPILRPYGGPSVKLNARYTMRHSTTQADRQQLPGFQHANLSGLSHGPTPAADDTSQSHRHPSLPNVRHTLPNLRSDHENVPEDFEPDGFVQTRLSFGEPKRSQKKRSNQMQLHIDDVPSRSKPRNPAYRKPKRVNQEHRSSPVANIAGHVDNYVGNRLNNHRLAKYDIVHMRHDSPQQISRSPGLPVTSTTNLAHGNEKWLDGDSRKYLIRRQCSEAEHRRKGRQPLKRAKTDRLPFEKVPEKEGLQHLVLTVAPNNDQLVGPLGGMVGEDSFCSDCRAGIGFSDGMDLADVTDIETKLKSILSIWTERNLGETTEVELNIRSHVKGKTTAA